MTYDKTIDYLYDLERFGVKLGLENISSILRFLSNPHQKFKSIHIAGTNGKGSTAAMIASILQQAGYKTGLYTSPHLTDFRERIMIDGVMIPKPEVIKLTKTIRDKMEDGFISLTFFEFTTAMAFLYFAKEMVDFAVIEVGMGGRLDATNVLTPVLGVITEIDIEHAEHLGEDIKSIASEKGGIIKRNGTVILSSVKTDVTETIESICKEKSTKLYRIGKDFIGERENTDIHPVTPSKPQSLDQRGMTQVKSDSLREALSFMGGSNWVHSQRFKFTDRYNEIRNTQSAIQNLEIPLLGNYQIINASTAVKTTLILNESGFEISEEAIRNGLKNVRWKGRLEIVSENPLIVLDGAHNPAAAKVLSEELKRIRNSEFGIQINKLILIIGILKDKDYKRIISFLAPISDYIIITRPKSPRAREPEDLMTESLKYTDKAEIIEDISKAISKAKNFASQGDLICITGSFFTVGEAKLEGFELFVKMA